MHHLLGRMFLQDQGYHKGNMSGQDELGTLKDYIICRKKIPGFIPAKIPYQRSSVMNDVALSTAPKYTPGPRLGGKG